MANKNAAIGWKALYNKSETDFYSEVCFLSSLLVIFCCSSMILMSRIIGNVGKEKSTSEEK